MKNDITRIKREAAQKAASGILFLFFGVCGVLIGGTVGFATVLFLRALLEIPTEDFTTKLAFMSTFFLIGMLYIAYFSFGLGIDFMGHGFKKYKEARK